MGQTMDQQATADVCLREMDGGDAIPAQSLFIASQITVRMCWVPGFYLNNRSPFQRGHLSALF